MVKKRVEERNERMVKKERVGMDQNEGVKGRGLFGGI